jgi:tRNA dimethylallyltransferase
LRVAGLTRSRESLYARAAARVERMLESGLVEETERLMRAGMGATARQAVGYRQVLAAPGAPARELEEAIVAATKRLVRRQEAWFRADPRVVWFDADSPDVIAALLAHLGASAARRANGIAGSVEA